MCDKYDPSTVEAFTLLSREMEVCVFKQPNKDPKEWMHKLDQINILLAMVGGPGVDYLKNDTQMTDHIINKLPPAQYKHLNTVSGIRGMMSLTLIQF